jgi:hypothetical protein
VAPAPPQNVARIARAAGVKCYTDPFVSNSRAAEQNTLLTRLAGWLHHDPQNPPIMLRAAQPVQAVRAPRNMQSAQRS